MKDDSSPSKKFKLDKALDETIDDDLLSTQNLFKAYQRGELSTSILSREEERPSTKLQVTCESSTRPQTSTNPPSASTVHPQVSKSNPTSHDSVETSSTSNQQTSPSKRSANSLLVNARQRGNPILKFIRNVAWEFVDMEPDYIMGRNTCGLYLSLRYHNFNPNYIHGRIEKLGKTYELRVLLVQVDITEPYAALKELTRISILANMTLMLAWSAEEAGRYLDTYKALENKPVDLIKEKISTSFLAQAEDFLTSIRAVNKTDTSTLLTHFGSMEAIMKADVEALSNCPGLGAQKAKRIYEMFRTPFPRSGRS